MTAPRVLLVDEDALFASALEVVLAAEGYAVVARVPGSLTITARELRELDLVVVSSARLPDLPSLAAAVRRPNVLVLAPACDHEGLIAALDSGAQGYLGKDTDLEQLLAAVAAVLRGEAVIPPPMLGGLLHELVQRRRQPDGPPGLTPLSRREREVLQLLAQGHAQEGIAKALVISPQTARTHIQKVIGKLGAHSRVEAVAVALRHGLVAAS